MQDGLVGYCWLYTSDYKRVTNHFTRSEREKGDKMIKTEAIFHDIAVVTYGVH